ncbi:MAG: ADP-ribosylglycohydrolase family protein [Propionibacteriaceae bacterium]|nr:ADP-ribosylglycohydrolase family protein [Propionibacteriaceae bacterium]
MMLGMLLGDVRNPSESTLQSGPAAHQLCWTLDALIRHRLHTRARERDGEFDPTDPVPAPTDHIRVGLLRWGTVTRGWKAHSPIDGWLAGLPALADDRGPTPVIDAAWTDLTEGRPLSSHDFRDSSVLFRTLPIAASAVVADPDLIAGWCSAAGSMTHGHPEAWSTAAFLGVLTGSHLADVFCSGPWVPLDLLAPIRWFLRSTPGHPLLDRLLPAISEAQWSPHALAALVPDDTAASVLAGALYLFRHARNARPQEVRALATNTGSPTAVASITGALIGLEQGLRWLDAGELSRHELSWALDALARDYCVTIWSPPAFDDEMDVLDEMAHRYPWT